MSGPLLYDRLSPEARTLVDEAYSHLSRAYEPETHLVAESFHGRVYRSVRSTMYYALALLIKQGAEGAALAEELTDAVLRLQLDAPEEIWHGVFRHPDAPEPPRGLADWRRVSPDARYIADLAWEGVTARYDRLLRADPALAGEADRLGALLRRSLLETVPVVWDTYEPNIREFIGMTLAMLLEHFEPLLSPGLVRRCERAARCLIEGAVSRVEQGLTPLNTNIRIMYVFVLDWFGRRLGEEGWRAEALREARALRAEYDECHAVAEYNSPTYCGVDLSTLGFWRRYSASAELRDMGTALEADIWRDMAAFYNPALRNFSGPYSRCYEMDMAVHTCFCDLLYLGLGAERFPFHPFSIESVINPLTVLGDIRIPPDAAALMIQPRGERLVRRDFRELSERGDPRCNRALCTATAWITPDLMIGALSGSENPSHQLHPLTAMWRAGEGLGTLRLLRCLPGGRMCHLHTVRFDGTAGPGLIEMTVRNDCPRDVELFFEVSAPGLIPDAVRNGEWRLPDLCVRVETDAPAPDVRPDGPDSLRIVYPAPAGAGFRFRLRFDRDSCRA